jgi:hypothetical protein
MSDAQETVGNRDRMGYVKHQHDHRSDGERKQSVAVVPQSERGESKGVLAADDRHTLPSNLVLTLRILWSS